MTQEAHAYADAYLRALKRISTIAKANGINMVLRADVEPINRDDRADVIKRINSNVVYHYRLDLTQSVIHSMNSEPDESVERKVDDEVQIGFLLPSPTSKRVPIYCDQCGKKLPSDKVCDCESVHAEH